MCYKKLPIYFTRSSVSQANIAEGEGSKQLSSLVFMNFQMDITPDASEPDDFCGPSISNSLTEHQLTGVCLKDYSNVLSELHGCPSMIQHDLIV